ncbi:MAG: hypothetical protein WC076_02000 [Terrimicrobiaceae bacterium]
MSLVGGGHGVGQLQPPLHGYLDETGLVVERIEEFLGAQHGPQIHEGTGHVLGDHLSTGRGHAIFQPLVAARISGIEPPLGMGLPCFEILDRMRDVFRHEPLAPAFEIENTAACPVLLDFRFPAVLQDFDLETGNVGRFAPSQFPKAVKTGLVIMEQFGGLGRALLDIGHALPLPLFPAVKTKLGFQKWRAGCDGVSVAAPAAGFCGDGRPQEASARVARKLTAKVFLGIVG